ncbi:MAG: tRNA (adenosine(37)-N6)-threonylcarbamoyltransferase complex ATPase subunit type 1 TsaE, partial [Alphaproteobacteria bacterium]|nr:tRNA (adenosine(37)-N6)-threonylcarbamoyltransferase complex ATPase subunit type 1 TsaE [Alphaproteobacteria bacterium]
MTSTWQIPKADERGVVRLAELIALKLCAGDLITLSGDLGAGKTTFARALIRAVVGQRDLDVPSPTFALMQSYDSQRVPIVHLDLYRLNDATELVELGIEDMVHASALVVEWPERLPDALSPNHLAIALADGSDANERSVTLTASGTWCARLIRIKAIADFLLQRPDWSAGHLSYLQGDASARTYARIEDGPRPALLMDAPKQPDGPPIQNGQPYSALACLAEDVRPFVAIANTLGEIGLRAPQIYAADLEHGLLLVEDFGDRVFGAAIAAGADQHLLWRTATEVLVHLRSAIADHTWSFTDGSHHRLPVFTSDVMQVESALLLEWYWPLVHGAVAPDAARKEFQALCLPIFNRVSRANRHWVLRDFHSPNLIWMPDQVGIGRVGLIDFQDALRGPAEYDLISLLQDARIDVPQMLEDELFAHLRKVG